MFHFSAETLNRLIANPAGQPGIARYPSPVDGRSGFLVDESAMRTVVTPALERAGQAILGQNRDPHTNITIVTNVGARPQPRQEAPRQAPYDPYRPAPTRQEPAAPVQAAANWSGIPAVVEAVARLRAMAGNAAVVFHRRVAPAGAGRTGDTAVHVVVDAGHDIGTDRTLFLLPMSRAAARSLPVGGTDLFDPMGVRYAQAHGRIFYVPFDLQPQDANAARALVQVLDGIGEHLVMTGEPQLRQALFAEQERAFLTRTGLSAQDADQFGREILSLQGRIAELTRQLSDAIQQMEARRLLHAAAQSGAHAWDETQARELERLKSHEKIVRIEMRDNGSKVVVHTTRLACTDPNTGRVYDMGAYAITLDLTAKTVHWVNKTRTIDRRQHPHIVENRACLGTLSEMLPTLFASGEVAAMAILCIAFLETVDSTDPWGRTIAAWPMIRDENGRRAATLEETRAPDGDEDEEEGEEERFEDDDNDD